MSDPKNEPKRHEPEELDLDSETVADLEPESQDTEQVGGGAACAASGACEVTHGWK